jgi:SPP1 gp7 family putative phage head morphogenesis protein
MADLARLEEQALSALERLQIQYERQVATVLRDALDQMRAEMQRLYDKYAIDGMLTKAEMTRYARYAAMEKQMLAILDPALRKSLRTITRLTEEQYQAAFFRYAWALDNGASVRLSWGVLNMDTILENLDNEMRKISLKTYGQGARIMIRRALTEGLSQGKSYAQMIKDLRKALDTTYANALRILRTEGQTAINAGQYNAYLRALDQGVEGKRVWVATLDGRTRDQHAAMDGKSTNNDGEYRMPNGELTPYPTWEGLSAGNRINCRCSERFEIEGYEPQLRRTRDQGVIPYQTYADWEKEYGPIVR